MMSGRSCEDISENSAESPIPLIFENEEGEIPKNDIMKMLGDIEKHVEMIRRRAFEIEEERDAMFTALYAFKYSRMVEDLTDLERNNVNDYIDRIYSRCSTIELSVKTPRDEPQKEALHRINEIIDTLIKDLQNDLPASIEICKTYMNACSSYTEKGKEDRIFNEALLGCTLDDQKRVRRRLQELMSYMEKLNFSS